MPTYEYACRACGHAFDVVQSMQDDSLTSCPECGGDLRKVFAPPAISFKGSGFYATDHGKKAKKPASSESKGSDSKGESDSKSGSDSKSSDSKSGSGDKGGSNSGAKESSSSGSGSGSDSSKKGADPS